MLHCHPYLDTSKDKRPNKLRWGIGRTGQAWVWHLPKGQRRPPDDNYFADPRDAARSAGDAQTVIDFKLSQSQTVMVWVIVGGW